jgi:hypothetical protein
MLSSAHSFIQLDTRLKNVCQKSKAGHCAAVISALLETRLRKLLTKNIGLASMVSDSPMTAICVHV